MSDQPSEPVIDVRLRDFLDSELRQAELDFARPDRKENQSARRRAPLGILVAAAVVLAVIVVAPRVGETPIAGTGGSPTPNGVVEPSPSAGVSSAPAASESVPSVAPSAAVSAAASPPIAAPSAPTSGPPSGLLPSAAVDCGRISPGACSKAIILARAGHGDEVAGANRIVVDDTCPPSSLCDRKYPFDSIVVFVTAGRDTAGWYAFNVVGLEYDTPTKADRWESEIPAHVIQRLTEPQPTP